MPLLRVSYESVLVAWIAIVAGLSPIQAAEPTDILDLLTYGTPSGGVMRIYGANGLGSSGTPVTGGFDCDGDGHNDFGFAGITTSPLGRNGAGEITLVFGDGKIAGELDTAGFCPRVLKIAGDQINEVAGAEIWLDDVTGDGLGDLMIGRQNYTPAAGREGAGALGIIIGRSELRNAAQELEHFDLRAPSTNVTMISFVGAAKFDRLGIWMRGGDVTGDGIADVLVAADQEDLEAENNRGTVYVIRGGAHLAFSQTIDLMNFGSTSLTGHIARIRPPSGSGNYHLGATLQAGDLDGNGRAEVFMGAALNRAGAGLCYSMGECASSGGAPRGKLFIAWDDLFPTNSLWPAGLTIDLGASTNSSRITMIQGDTFNDVFGEEVLGGLDYDGNGKPDLFVGDLTASGANGFRAGTGHVFYDAEVLKGLSFSLSDSSLPSGVVFSVIQGPSSRALGADTVTHADYDLDGYADLVFGNPHDAPPGRVNAGTMHVLYGQKGGWPSEIDLKIGNLPDPSIMRILRIDGAKARDTLCYSAAAGDIDKDGRMDIIVNEMIGDGAGGEPVDVGNLLVISAAALLNPHPPITSSLTTNDMLELTFPAINGETYTVERSTNIPTGNWSVLTNGLTGTNIEVSLAFALGADRQGFYRVGVTPTPITTNRRPIAKSDATNTSADVTIVVDVLSNDSDPDDDPISLGAVSNSLHGGTVTPDLNDTVRYMPATNFTGLDVFTYTAVDGHGGSMVGCVNITVTPE